MAQKATTRQERAEQLTNVRVYELQDGVFALHCENENGEPRKRILEPAEMYPSPRAVGRAVSAAAGDFFAGPQGTSLLKAYDYRE